MITLLLLFSLQTYDEDFFGEDEEYLNALDVHHPDSPYGLIQGTISHFTEYLTFTDIS